MCLICLSQLTKKGFLDGYQLDPTTHCRKHSQHILVDQVALVPLCSVVGISRTSIDDLLARSTVCHETKGKVAKGLRQNLQHSFPQGIIIGQQLDSSVGAMALGFT